MSKNKKVISSKIFDPFIIKKEKEKPTVPSKINSRVSNLIKELDLKITPILFVLAIILFAIIIFLLFMLIFNNVVMAILGLIGGVLVFRSFLTRRRKEKETLFTKQLPDALIAVANSLKAGFSLDQALEFASISMPEPTKSEFSRIHLNYRVGYSLQEAIETLPKKYNNTEVKLFVSSLILQNQIGGNVIPFLNELSEVLRERLRLKEQVVVGTAQQRLSATIVTIIPYAILMLLQLSGYNALTSTFRGILLLIFAICLQGVGLMVMNNSMKIDI
ncbi:MAG TPA: type II secretion system F family protein [Caldisericia bacterium]|nr:type II secretion system F family protein [Caldisericia bacterium]HPO29050.1 type II secretion system F family protein [Caldisericia bacterium]